MTNSIGWSKKILFRTLDKFDFELIKSVNDL